MATIMSQQSSIRIAHSLKVCPAAAVKEFYAGVVQPNMAFVIFSVRTFMIVRCLLQKWQPHLTVYK
jgi:hypothetical protein